MIKMSEKAKKFLMGNHIGKLATVMKDGSPHVTPIWYMIEDGKIFVNTTTNRVKYHNIKRDSRVAFLVDDEYPYVLFLGKGRIADERDAKKDIETLAIKYTGEEKGKKSARTMYWKQPRTTVEIIPEKVVEDL